MESGVSAQTYPKHRGKSVLFLILTASQLRIYGRKTRFSKKNISMIKEGETVC